MLISALVVAIGVSVAYKNTKQLLYDNSSIISFSAESVYIYDKIIDYKDIKEKAELLKNIFKSEYITIYHRI